MARVETEHGFLVVHVEGADKIWALKSRLSIPLEHVVGIEPDEDEAKKWHHGVRAPGTFVPGVITAGTFYQHGERVFWDVHHPEKAVCIQLQQERYNRLVIEVADPAATIAAVRAALAR